MGCRTAGQTLRTAQGIRLLLDTTVLLDALRGRAGRRALLAGFIRREGQLFISTLSIAEVYIATRPHEVAATEQLLGSLNQLPVTASIARRAGVWKAQMPKLSMTDLLIASTAVEDTLELLTDNRDHYPIPELRLYRPAPPTVESLLAV